MQLKNTDVPVASNVRNIFQQIEHQKIKTNAKYSDWYWRGSRSN
jgi:hypothetical protein